jgi:hypothetical protein
VAYVYADLIADTVCAVVVFVMSVPGCAVNDFTLELFAEELADNGEHPRKSGMVTLN